MSLIIILLLIIILALVSLSGFLFFYYFKINKQIDALMEVGKVKDLREVILSHMEKTKEMDGELKKAMGKIEILEGISKITFQKMEVMRFNPFKNLGGDQSFAIALLDGNNNGFVISSLFAKDGSRLYIKPVIDGKSKNLLSSEEEEVITSAINQKSNIKN